MNKFRKEHMMTNCPNCGGINIGRLNKYSYFCRECFVEVAITRKNHIYVYIHSEDGMITRRIKVG
ncbi:hypothetical protein [Alkaliphilus peptidifermentans]|uniref:Inhibitor of sigma-G Gin n=1 Tax=Alkaliphilus peptidifermentans DSM 18978 TaxID=1120976 RepID=A0A1G5BPA9_9FIRM|nr:hypothetical protein [Alkaliphilus peptidifermentans]SCX92033.1 hypothetical protein SAMN03080606_00483 [Alkaliphilus peptidifermentans DSM 18978]